MKSVLKKMAGFLGAAVMTAGLLLSTPVYAESYVNGAVIDGAQAHGEVGYNSSSVSAFTRHKIHVYKSVSLTAYASYYGNYCCYGTDSNSGTDSNIKGANVNVLSPFTPIGGKATHSVSWWTGKTDIGYYE